MEKKKQYNLGETTKRGIVQYVGSNWGICIDCKLKQVTHRSGVCLDCRKKPEAENSRLS